LIANTIYGIVVVQLKAAIILQCLRVLVPAGVRNVAFWTFHILLWAHVIFYVICTFVEIFMCNPREKAWNPTIVTGHCMDSKAVNIAAAVINTSSDLVLVIIPQFIIWGLNMPTRKKWAVSVVFFVGLLYVKYPELLSRVTSSLISASATAAAAVRLYYSIDLYSSKDFTWGVTLMGLWVPVELCCGFLVACIPMFPRFFKQQPALMSMGSSLRSLFRLKSSRSDKRSSERLGSSETPRPSKKPIVSDIEFEALVKRTDLSMLSGGHSEFRR
jgi:hypothetical protein